MTHLFVFEHPLHPRHPEIGLFPIQNISVSISFLFNCFSTSFKAVYGHPFGFGVPLTSITFSLSVAFSFLILSFNIILLFSYFVYNF